MTNTPMLTKNFSKLQYEVAKHVAADQVVQGRYWDTKKQKGCFIGCLTHTCDASLLEIDYGISPMLASVASNIFEGLPSKKAVKFFKKFPKAVACDNKDLGEVVWRFLQLELKNMPYITKEIQTVIDGISKLARGEQWDKHEAKDAADAVRCALYVIKADALNTVKVDLNAALDAAGAAAKAAALDADNCVWAAADNAALAVAHVARAVVHAKAIEIAKWATTWANAWAADASTSSAIVAEWGDDNARAVEAVAAMQNYRRKQAKTFLKLIKKAPVIMEID